MAKFTPIRSGDDALDRAQDAIAKAIGGKFEKPASPPKVSGSKGGNAALASLLKALASLGLIVDTTT